MERRSSDLRVPLQNWHTLLVVVKFFFLPMRRKRKRKRWTQYRLLYSYVGYVVVISCRSWCNGYFCWPGNRIHYPWQHRVDILARKSMRRLEKFNRWLTAILYTGVDMSAFEEGFRDGRDERLTKWQSSAGLNSSSVKPNNAVYTVYLQPADAS